jgi:(R,R)-butanediol dehydrogenase/meso-butanediol dehydrogenase/diacetyl reductase
VTVPARARAVRWHGRHDVRLETVPVPEPGPSDVVLRVAFCGICGSDLHEIASGPHAVPVREAHPLSGARAPIVLGHEFSGTVVGAGPLVGFVRPGDRVAVEPNYRCGRCTSCRDGDYHVCVGFGFAGLMGDGGMAEYAVIPDYMVHRLPVGFDLAAAAVLEPAAVALHGVRRSGFEPGADAVVVGLGPVGLLVCALLRLRGAGRVVGFDPVPARRQMALDVGADVAWPPGPGAGAAVREMTGGDGAHVAFEVVGSQDATDLALACLRTRGELLLLGLVPELRLPAFDMVNAEQRVTTSVGYRDCHPELVALVQAGRLDLSTVVGEVVDLADAPKVLDDQACSGARGLKTLVRCTVEEP